MTGYLSINDDGVLSEYTIRAIAKIFARIGSGGEPLPDHASGAQGAHMWTSPLYNPGSAHLALIRGMIFAARTGIADREIVVIGDSTGEGYNAGGPRERYGWVGQTRAALGGVPGYIVAMPAFGGNGWSGAMVQGSIRQPGVLNPNGAADVHTLTLDVPHTGGAIYLHCATGGTVQVSVDGGAPQTLPITSGDGYHSVTPTVTGDRAHTYAVSSAASIILHGFRPTYSGPRLKITNMSRGGMNAGAWRPDNLAAKLGHWDGMIATTRPDAIICALGINQPSDNGTIGAADLTALWADIAALGLPTIAITPGGLDLTGTEDWVSQYTAQFNAADKYGLPLLDFASVIGTGQAAQARGFMADATHPNRLGFAMLAAATVRTLT